jgi:hypothetical protein
MSNRSMPFILISVLLSSFSASSAQGKPWQVILCSGDTLTPCSLDSLHDNILTCTCDTGTLFVPVDSIAALVQHKEGNFSKGALIGSLVGAVAGGVIAAETYQPSPFDMIGEGGATVMGGIAGASFGFFIGGIIGSSSSGSEFDLRGKKLIVKLLIIQGLLAQRNDVTVTI